MDFWSMILMHDLTGCRVWIFFYGRVAAFADIASKNSMICLPKAPISQRFFKNLGLADFNTYLYLWLFNSQLKGKQE